MWSSPTSDLIHDPLDSDLIEDGPRTSVQWQTDWNTGLFSCCNDCKTCWFVVCCPPCAFGQIVYLTNTSDVKGHSGMGNFPFGNCGWCCVAYLVGPLICFVSCSQRKLIREKYALREEPCSDAMVHGLCLCCAMCQEITEMQRQGEDMEPILPSNGSGMLR